MTTLPRCAVVGYASIDYQYATEPFEGPGRTTLVRSPLHVDGARPGAASYFALALAQHGLPVSLISWVGPDESGALFTGRLADAGIDVATVTRTGTRSPACHMYCPDGGEPVTFFDPGDADQMLTSDQEQAVASATAVLIGVGPAQATAAALAVADPRALLLWAVKSDPGSLPPELARALATRADVICHSEAETDFLAQTCGLDIEALMRDGTLVATTRGSRGAVLRSSYGEIVVGATEPVSTFDATGAGDTFAAGLLARLMQCDSSNTVEREHAVRGACADARALLRTRTSEG